MKNYYLAVDIGASSGRCILGFLEKDIVQVEEVHRFKNGVKKIKNSLCWDIESLFNEIIFGLKKCKEINKIPVSIGIDTWGVDFVLLDKKGNILGECVSYRDNRTVGMDALVEKKISEYDLFKRTGIQKMPFNTIYQLMAVKENTPEFLEEAVSFLMIPDYLNYRLCGVISNEYTNATTTSLVNVTTNEWDKELIKLLDLPEKLFGEITKSGTKLGSLLPSIKEQVGFNCEVITPATHDTASAVSMSDDEQIFISSGTWSLMGVIKDEPNCSIKSHTLGFSNEGGYDKKIVYLKNIMGLWIIQNVQKELDKKYSFSDLCSMAENSNIDSIINCNDQSFFSPENMIDEIKSYCKKTNQAIPETPGEIASVVYNSLASCYAETVKEIELCLDNSFTTINIIGGGSNADYLNKLTAQKSGKTVVASLPEATAVGNIIIQMLSNNEIIDLDTAKQKIKQSFESKMIEPAKLF